MDSDFKYGIEAIAFHAPKHYIELADLANARGIDPQKYISGLGQRQMAIATPVEDTVYLAINAAKKTLENFDIDPSEIGKLVVGTETGVDHSKPVAVYVHQALGLPSNCNTYETKHACFGAMAAISSAGDWIASKRSKGLKALIIAADIARYGVNTPGEPTQGAGAVAMVISDNPTLVEFDPDVSGNFTKQVMDFWRPLYSKEAIADGHYSIDCYLDALVGTLKDAAPAIPRLEDLQACLYHVPFVKMAWKAHYRHYEHYLGRSVAKEDPVLAAIKESYAQRSSPWLSLNANVGNIYTGSIFLALIDVLRQGKVAAHKPISLFSYGSGCAASLSLISPAENYERFSHRLDPQPELDQRVALSIEHYESIMARTEKPLGENDAVDPADWGLDNDYLYLGNRKHARRYAGLD